MDEVELLTNGTQADPCVLLEWLESGTGDERAMQINALERLCMLLLMSDNVDRCFELYSPKTFIPALCNIFIDETTPDFVLEIAARALTYFLDVSVECTHRITAIDGAVRAIASKLIPSDINDRVSRDLAEQCVKVLDKMCGVCPPVIATTNLIELLATCGASLHNDTLKSALSLLQRLCKCGFGPVPDISSLLTAESSLIADKALSCLPSLVRRGAPLPHPLPPALLSNPDLLSMLSRSDLSLNPKFLLPVEDSADFAYDWRLADILLTILFEYKTPEYTEDTTDPEVYEFLLSAIRSGDVVLFNEYIDKVDNVNWSDCFGQTLLNWAAAFAPCEILQSLLDRGADPRRGSRAPSLHYAAAMRRIKACRMLLHAGAFPDLKDDDGKIAYERARERANSQTVHFLSVAAVEWKPPKRRVFYDGDDLEPYVAAILKVPPNVTGLRLLYRLLSHLTDKEVHEFVTPRAAKLLQIVFDAFRNGDEEPLLLSLHILNQLLSKDNTYFFYELSRLGILQMVTELSKSIVPECTNPVLTESNESRCQGSYFKSVFNHRGFLSNSGILISRPYSWGDWLIVEASEYITIWNEYIALEFPRNSNGNYRYLINNQVWTMRPGKEKSSSQIECLDSFIDFLDRLSVIRDVMSFTRSSVVLFDGVNFTRKLNGNWFLQLVEEGKELKIKHNASDIQVAIQVNDTKFFRHFNPDKTDVSISTTIPLKKKSNNQSLSFPSSSSLATLQRSTLLKAAVDIAKEIQEKFIRGRHVQLSEAAKKLKDLIPSLTEKNAGQRLLDLLKNGSFSSFEIYSSGLLDALAIVDMNDLFPLDLEPVALVEALVSVIDDKIELPLFLYPKYSSTTQEESTRRSDLRLLGTKMRVFLEKTSDDDIIHIPNKHHAIHLNPFICVEQLKRQIYSKFKRQWYEFDRKQLHFIKAVKNNPPVVLPISSEYKGILKWTGTNAFTKETFCDPAKCGLMRIVPPNAIRESVTERDLSRRFFVEMKPLKNEKANHFFQLDLGLYFIPVCYVVFKSPEADLSPYNWDLYVSSDCSVWTLLDKTRTDLCDIDGVQFDVSNQNMSVEMQEKGCRYLKFQKHDECTSDEEVYTFSLEDFEIFGVILDSVESSLRPRGRDVQRSILRSFHSLAPGVRITKRPDGKLAVKLPRNWSDVKFEQRPTSIKTTVNENKIDVKAMLSGRKKEKSLKQFMNEGTKYLSECIKNEVLTKMVTAIDTPGTARQKKSMQQLKQERLAKRKRQNFRSAATFAATYAGSQTSGPSLSMHSSLDEVIATGLLLNSPFDEPFALQCSSDSYLDEAMLESTFSSGLPSNKRSQIYPVKTDENKRQDEQQKEDMDAVPNQTASENYTNITSMDSQENESERHDSKVENLEPLNLLLNNEGVEEDDDVEEEEEADTETYSDEEEDFGKVRCDDENTGASGESSEFHLLENELDLTTAENIEDYEGVEYDEIISDPEEEFDRYCLSQDSWMVGIYLNRTSKALIPAFDPRPGRINTSQTQDIDFSTPSDDSEMSDVADTSLNLTLRLTGCKLNTKPEIKLSNPNYTLFSYALRLIYTLKEPQACEFLRKAWDSIFTITIDIDNRDGMRDTETSSNSSDVCANAEQSTEKGCAESLPMYIALSKLHHLMQTRGYQTDIFLCPRLSAHLNRQLKDVIAVASNFLPSWCEDLITTLPFIFPLEIRLKYFKATAFGISRSLIWLVNQTDSTNDFNATRHVGRLKHERGHISRNNLLEDTKKLLNWQASHKAELDVVWNGEDGTGLGPTLEFFTLVSHEFQKTVHGLWLTDSESEEYVHTDFGLFPAPYPPDSSELESVCEMFRFIGIFLGKCLLDSRLCDFHFSDAFIKLICPPVHRRKTLLHPTDALDFEDLAVIDKYRSKTIEYLLKNDPDDIDFENFCLTFEYNPPCGVYKYVSCALGDHVKDEPVTKDNYMEYTRLMTAYILRDGIKKQVDSLLEGLSLVVDPKKLYAFTPTDIRLVLCGDQCPSWTREDLLLYVEPKNGYTRECPMFLYFVEVMLSLTAEQRKNVVQFITGCRSLPIGGLSSLNPRLSIARKDGTGFPSINTCNHFLKIPQYESESELKEKLLLASYERGFYFN